MMPTEMEVREIPYVPLPKVEKPKVIEPPKKPKAAPVF